MFLWGVATSSYQIEGAVRRRSMKDSPGSSSPRLYTGPIEFAAMNDARSSREVCACGRSIVPPVAPEGPWIELTCGCGRRFELERANDRWAVRAELVPERSVPLAGFSRELRLRADTQRFRFEHSDAAGRRSPVHVVFSPSQRVAEVKRGDVKALRLSDVGSASEARRRWIEWTGRRTLAPALRPRPRKAARTPD